MPPSTLHTKELSASCPVAHSVPMFALPQTPEPPPGCLLAYEAVPKKQVC